MQTDERMKERRKMKGYDKGVYMHGRAMEWEGVEKEELVLKEEGGGGEGVDLRKVLVWRNLVKHCLCGLSSKPTPYLVMEKDCVV